MEIHYHMIAYPDSNNRMYKIFESTRLMFSGTHEEKCNRLFRYANKMENKGIYVEVESDIFALKDEI